MAFGYWYNYLMNVLQCHDILSSYCYIRPQFIQLFIQLFNFLIHFTGISPFTGAWLVSNVKDQLSLLFCVWQLWLWLLCLVTVGREGDRLNHILITLSVMFGF